MRNSGRPLNAHQFHQKQLVAAEFGKMMMWVPCFEKKKPNCYGMSPHEEFAINLITGPTQLKLWWCDGRRTRED